MALVSKTFSDLITFTRSTNGTYVNSAGLITNSTVGNYLTQSNTFDNAAWTKSNSFVQTNLLLYSEDLTNAAWTKSFGGTGIAPVVTANQGVAPDGTLTADRVDFNCVGALITDRSYITQSFTVVAGDPSTVSFWIKAFDSATIGKTIRFVCENGGVQTTNIFTITDSWQRITVTGAAATGASNNCLMETRGTYTSSATASVLLWGGQAVKGSSPGDYRATTTAALPILYPDYNGVVRARKLAETTATGNHLITQSPPTGLAAGVVCTISFFAKASERSFISLEMNCGVFAQFNLATQAVSSSAYGSGVVVGTSIVSFGNGWYRCSLSGYGSSTATTAGYIYLGNSSYTGDGSSGIYIADALLNDGTAVGPYYETTSTITYAPRFDYDPATRAARGLLMEPQRTNLLTYSEQFDNAAWLKYNSSITSNATIAPNGTATAESFRADSSVYPQVSETITTIASTVYTFSVYAKTNTAAQLGLEFRGSGTNPDCVFNLDNGTIVSGTGAIVSAGNGWYRCSITKTSVDASEIAIISLGAAPAVNDSIYIWGAQLEAGAFATSYIATVASQVTRAGDSFTGNLFSTWYNQPEGTLYVEGTVAVQNGVTNFSIIAGAANNNYVSRDARFVVNGVTVNFNVLGAVDGIYPVKFSGGYKQLNSATSVNGAAATVNTTTVVNTGTQLLASPSSNYMHIKRITYYPQRLTNAQLQSITT